MDAVTAKKKTQLVRKHKIGLFLQNELSEFIRMKKSTSLTLSMNPVEEETDYIATNPRPRSLQTINRLLTRIWLCTPGKRITK